MTNLMNSLSSLLPTLSSELGIEIIAIENRADQSNPYSIRFADLDPLKSFSLVISRSWRTTQVRFKADSFAGEVVKYLCTQIYIKSRSVFEMIKENELLFSNIDLEIDQRAFNGKIEELSKNPTLKFEVVVLTTDSSIAYGLVNQQEEMMLRFTFRLLASVLPITSASFRNPDEVVGFPEGAVSKVLVNKYERDPRNRREAIEIHGRTCMACGFNFQERYGALGDDYIVVHHVVQVSSLGTDYTIDPRIDLVTICANCHAMVHRQDPPLSIDQLKSILRS